MSGVEPFLGKKACRSQSLVFEPCVRGVNLGEVNRQPTEADPFNQQRFQLGWRIIGKSAFQVSELTANCFMAQNVIAGYQAKQSFFGMRGQIANDSPNARIGVKHTTELRQGRGIAALHPFDEGGKLLNRSSFSQWLAHVSNVSMLSDHADDIPV
jgi:hypothetical protein